MILALHFSADDNCAKIADRILTGETTIEEEKKICGSFMKLVFEGDSAKAFLKADAHNKIAFLSYLISRQRFDEYRELVLSIDQLIKFED